MLSFSTFFSIEINHKPKNVLITGAASGTGRKIAWLLAQERANLAIIDIDKQRLSDTQSELRQKTARIQTYICDVSNRSDIEKNHPYDSKGAGVFKDALDGKSDFLIQGIAHAMVRSHRPHDGSRSCNRPLSRTPRGLSATAQRK